MAKLPTPSAALLQQSNLLATKIKERIDAANGISFAKFMEMALYDSEHGYYTSGNNKIFGEAGDFHTSYQVSPLFAKCLAIQFQQILQQINGDIIIELGGGDGSFAVKVMQYFKQQKLPLPQYKIIEISTSLQAIQKDYIATVAPELLPYFSWQQQLPTKKINGIIFGNEFIDALPVNKFIVNDNNEIAELFVNLDQENDFCWQQQPITSTIIHNKISQLQQRLENNFAAGYNIEINFNIEPVINNLSDIINQGVVILIDYGYIEDEFYLPQRNNGTLMCHLQHHAHDNPLIYPGIQDITAFVDFSCVADAAIKHGFSPLGYCSQSEFLTNLGILNFNDPSCDLKQQMQNSAALKKLLMPYEMGEVFKVIAFGKGVAANLVGF